MRTIKKLLVTGTLALTLGVAGCGSAAESTSPSTESSPNSEISGSPGATPSVGEPTGTPSNAPTPSSTGTPTTAPTTASSKAPKNNSKNNSKTKPPTVKPTVVPVNQNCNALNIKSSDIGLDGDWVQSKQLSSGTGQLVWVKDQQTLLSACYIAPNEEQALAQMQASAPDGVSTINIKSRDANSVVWTVASDPTISQTAAFVKGKTQYILFVNANNPGANTDKMLEVIKKA